MMRIFFVFKFLHTHTVYSLCITIYIYIYMWRESLQNKSFMGLKLWTSWGVDPQIFKIQPGRTIFYFLTSKLTFFRKLKRISFWKCKRRSFLYLEVYFWLRFPSQGSRRQRQLVRISLLTPKIIFYFCFDALTHSSVDGCHRYFFKN